MRSCVAEVEVGVAAPRNEGHEPVELGVGLWAALPVPDDVLVRSGLPPKPCAHAKTAVTDGPGVRLRTRDSINNRLGIVTDGPETRTSPGT